MQKILSLVSIVLATCAAPGESATTWYVAPAPLGSDTNPGTEQQPFATIQRGIARATDGDTLIVAEGTYLENIHFNGKNITLTSTNPSDPTVVQNTIIDGNQSGSVVTFSRTEDETCLLSCFTIQNGKATSTCAGGLRDVRTSTASCTPRRR